MNHIIPKLLRLLDKKNVDYYLISSSDEFLNEYVSEQDKRLKWITNFSGSNGMALISKDEKFFFTDGRYLLQSKKEINKCFKIIDINKTSFAKFLEKKLKNKKILLNTKTFTKDFIIKSMRHASLSNNKLIHEKKNLVDKIWKRKQIDIKKLFFLDQRIAGQTSAQKLKKINDLNIGRRVLVITSPEAVCWLLNIRGYDIDHTPLVMSRVIIKKNRIQLFIDKKKLPLNYKKKININVTTFDINDFEKKLSSLSDERIYAENQISFYFYNILKKKNKDIVFGYDYCKLLKSQKNKIEIKNSHKAHLYDGIALTNFFYWLEKSRKKKSLTEYIVANKLEEFRKKNDDYFSSSFPTIAATGANASIIHYIPNEKSSILRDNQLFLCDSGGQYYGSTTDITRTIFLGDKSPKNLFQDIYTKVLIGHINVSMIKFPLGTKGFQIDALARTELWRDGFDYSHGTGHGVGSFLGVHEGPQSISKSFNGFDLKPGMIISNEPGYYRNGEFGVRIENLILVKKSKNNGFLEFETLSLFPYENRLIKKDLLTSLQIKWLNSYHKHVFDKISPHIDNEEKNWLRKKTMPIQL